MSKFEKHKQVQEKFKTEKIKNVCYSLFIQNSVEMPSFLASVIGNIKTTKQAELVFVEVNSYVKTALNGRKLKGFDHLSKIQNSGTSESKNSPIDWVHIIYTPMGNKR